jgi:hypothetical protein
MKYCSWRNQNPEKGSGEVMINELTTDPPTCRGNIMVVISALYYFTDFENVTLTVMI